MKHHDDMTESELREYIAERIRATSDPDLLRELINFMGELINKGGDNENVREPHRAA